MDILRFMAVAMRIIALFMGLFIVFFPLLPPETFYAIDPSTGKFFYFFRSHKQLYPFHLLWGLEGFRNFGLFTRILLVIPLMAALVLKLPRASQRFDFLKNDRRFFLIILLMPILATIFFFLVRVSPENNMTFADGAHLPRQVEGGMIFPAEILTCQIFIWAYKILSSFYTYSSGYLAVAIVSCLCGGVFALAAALFAASFPTSPGKRWILLIGILLCGYSVMFCGYVETTVVEISAMGLYIAFASKSMLASNSKVRTGWKFAALIALSVAMLSHAAGVLLLPSLLVLLADPLSAPGHGFFRSLLSRYKLRTLTETAAILGIPYLFIIVIPFFSKGIFGNILGGGDGIMFVPLTIDYAQRTSPFVNYSMVSFWHAADLFSTLLVGAPWAPYFLIMFLLGLKRGYIALNKAEKNFVGFLALATAGCGLVPVIWNHDFGMWGDWNLATCYLMPLNVLGWVGAIYIGSVPVKGNAIILRSVVPLLYVQILLAVGLWAQG